MNAPASYGSECSDGRVPVLLMVSGGSDSEAMLELACAWRDGVAPVAEDVRSGEAALSSGGRCGGEATDGHAACSGSGAAGPGAPCPDDDPLALMLADALPAPRGCSLHVLHVNHMLRGADADADAAFVRRRCEEFGVPCTVERVDIAVLAGESRNGMEAVAREQRYLLAERLLDGLCAQERVEPERGIVLTAHTLDDRIETFFMRSLVGTGPGGLSSIPRRRGRVRRPLLDATREQLREWLRARHSGEPDAGLWREDSTNDDGSNFRSRVRGELLPVLRGLRPGFEPALARTMDLMAEEDAAWQAQAETDAYLNLGWDGEEAVLPARVLAQAPRPLARRVLRCALLVVNPEARLEAVQIERVLDGAGREGFATETSGGIRVRVADGELHMSVAQ